jgi:hypothetical protein
MLRAIFGTDSALKVTNPVVNTTFADWWTSSGIPGAGLGQNPTKACIDQNGYISGMASTSGIISNVPMFLNGFVPASAARITICFKLKVLSAIAGNYQVLSFAQEGAPNVGVDYLFTTSAVWLATQAVGAELFVEVTYTRTTGLTSYTVNGVAQAATRTFTLSAAGATAWDAGKLVLNFVLSGIGTNGTTRFAIRDVHVIDDIAGDGITGSIGQARIVPLSVASAAGAGWAPSSGSASLTDTMNLVQPSAVTINSPTDKTPLTVGLSGSAITGARVLGVAFSMAGASTTISVSPTKVEISASGVNLPAIAALTPAGGLKYGLPLGVYSKALDGGNWNTAKIAAVSFKLTPDTAV